MFSLWRYQVNIDNYWFYGLIIFLQIPGNYVKTYYNIFEVIDMANLDPFSRVLTLPAKADPGKAQAKFENGVLELVIPKSEK
jgi:hypothetical protein